MASPSPSDNYTFKRDHRSMARLSYNHWLHTQLCGYLIHPCITTTSTTTAADDNNTSASIRIADIGTGTAIVPISLSAQLQQQGRIDGFDVSGAQFPPREWLPHNVHLYEQDVFAPFAEEFVGVYDVVHVRFFMTLVVDSEALGPLIRNLMTLLKPHGYLQWSEPDMSSTSVASISPSAPTQAAESLVQLMRSHAGTVWVPQLSNRMSREGLEVVTEDRIPVPDAYRMLFNLSHLITLEDVVPTHSTGSTDFGKSSSLLEALRPEFLNNGVSIDQSFVCVVARRPL